MHCCLNYLLKGYCKNYITLVINLLNLKKMIIANIVSTGPEYRIHVQCMHIFSTLRCANFWLRAHILSFASTDESMVVYFEKRWVKRDNDIGGVHGPMFLWKAVRTHWIFQNLARKMYYWANIYADLHRKNLAQSDKSNLRTGSWWRHCFEDAVEWNCEFSNLYIPAVFVLEGVYAIFHQCSSKSIVFCVWKMLT